MPLPKFNSKFSKGKSESGSKLKKLSLGKKDNSSSSALSRSTVESMSISHIMNLPIEDALALLSQALTPAEEVGVFKTIVYDAKTSSSSGIKSPLKKSGLRSPSRLSLGKSKFSSKLKGKSSGLDPRLENRAKRDNPDPENLAAVQINNVADLLNRIEAKKASIEKQKNDIQHFVQQTKDSLAGFNKDVGNRLLKIDETFKSQKKRLLNLRSRIQLQLTTSRPFGQEELNFRFMLEQLETKLKGPQGLNSQISELQRSVAFYSPEERMQHITLFKGEDDPERKKLNNILRNQQEMLETLISDARMLGRVADSVLAVKARE
ncbi:hypothetical protein PCE1_003195 [Barthelona sp. PCE]